MIILEQKMIADTADSTASILRHGDVFLGFTIEDGHRDKKVRGRTRIKAGLYDLIPYRQGEFYEFAKSKWGHEFVLLFVGVPNFEGVLYHWGNYVADTKGCPLINSSLAYNSQDKVYYGGGSRDQYKKFYAYVTPFVREHGKIQTRIIR